jgi:hypothetical protein
MVSSGIVLGHIVSSKGIEVDKSKIELITKLPTPKTVKDVRSFLGHSGFYCRFIEGFSLIAKPNMHFRLCCITVATMQHQDALFIAYSNAPMLFLTYLYLGGLTLDCSVNPTASM